MYILSETGCRDKGFMNKATKKQHLAHLKYIHFPLYTFQVQTLIKKIKPNNIIIIIVIL